MLSALSAVKDDIDENITEEEPDFTPKTKRFPIFIFYFYRQVQTIGCMPSETGSSLLRGITAINKECYKMFTLFSSSK